MTYEDRETRNQKCLASPQIGDYWHEMFVPMLVVVDVHPFGILVCDTLKEESRDCQTWDVHKSRWLSRAEFRAKLTYSTMPDKCIGLAVPEAHRWVHEQMKQIGYEAAQLHNHPKGTSGLF